MKITVVEGKHRPIFGRDLLPQLGLSLKQSNTILYVIQNSCPNKSQVALNFPALISVLVSLKTTLSNQHFLKKSIPTHQKGRREPINLQPIVNTELKMLIDKKHIKKINSCSDGKFI